MPEAAVAILANTITIVQAMSEWHYVAEASTISEDEMIPFSALGKNLIVYRTGTGLFATDRRCTHQAADLLRGYLDRETIECPAHQGRFNIRTGAPLSAPACEPLVTYAVKIVDGKIVVKLG